MFAQMTTKIKTKIYCKIKHIKHQLHLQIKKNNIKYKKKIIRKDRSTSILEITLFIVSYVFIILYILWTVSIYE